MKTYFKKMRIYALSFTMLLMLILTACGSTENGKEVQTEKTESESEQEVTEIWSTEDVVGEQETDQTMPEQDTSTQNKGSQAENTPIKEPASEAKEPVTEASVPVPEAEKTQPAETKKQTASQYTANILGNVESVGNGNFVISQITTSKASDGSDLAIKSDESVTLITVNYTDTTKFVICSSSDGGKTSSETAASIQNMVSGMQVMIDGSWNQNDFEAQKVTMYNFN